MNSIGKQIKKLRTAEGMTQAELAEKLGISPSTVGMYENGRRNPDNEMLIRICRLFSVTTDSLLGVVEKEESVVDATKIISEMSDQIRYSDEIMLNGFIMSPEDKEKLLYTIEVAVNTLLEQKKREKGK